MQLGRNPEHNGNDSHSMGYIEGIHRNLMEENKLVFVRRIGLQDRSLMGMLDIFYTLI